MRELVRGQNTIGRKAAVLKKAHKATFNLFLYQTHSDIDQTVYMDARKKYHKTACKYLPEDENLDVRNMSPRRYN